MTPALGNPVGLEFRSLMDKKAAVTKFQAYGAGQTLISVV